MLSFKICDKSNNIVFEYNPNKENESIAIKSDLIRSTIGAGISIPYHAQAEFKNRSFIEYPPAADDIPLFAEAVKRFIYETELIKHKYYLVTDLQNVPGIIR